LPAFAQATLPTVLTIAFQQFGFDLPAFCRGPLLNIGSKLAPRHLVFRWDVRSDGSVPRRILSRKTPNTHLVDQNSFFCSRSIRGEPTTQGVFC
jgi:hypothetical protein